MADEQPPQSTQPFGVPMQWRYPPYPPPPPPDVSKTPNWLEIFKNLAVVLGLLSAIVSGIYAAGSRTGAADVSSLRTEFHAYAEQTSVDTKAQKDVVEKANSAILSQINDINATLRRLNITKKNRPAHTSTIVVPTPN